MKQITMDYETYTDELHSSHCAGYDECIKDLIHLLRDIIAGDRHSLEKFGERAKKDPTRNAPILFEHLKMLADLKHLKEKTYD